MKCIIDCVSATMLQLQTHEIQLHWTGYLNTTGHFALDNVIFAKGEVNEIF